jgi:TPR repeat protein/precorrin-6B methylase 2
MRHGVTPVSVAQGNTQTTPMMVINTDMLRLVGDSDDMMAAVISHELGHLKAQHLSKRAEAAVANGFWGSMLGAAVEVGTTVLGIGIPGMATALGNVGAEVATAKFSRDQEREADALGVRAMAAAGYDPASAVRFWQLMATQTRSAGLWADTHPPASEREAAMDTLARSLAATYAANKLSPRGLPQYPDPYPAARYAGFEPTAAEVAAQTPYARGRQTYKGKSDSKNFDAALTLLNEAADSAIDTDERAMTLLGDVFQYGLGGQAIDAARAQPYYTRAAAKGFGPAIGSLGLMSFNGTGGKAVPKNVPEARRLFVLADSRGDAHSAAALGMMHMEGVGFPKDTFRARELAQRAADGGDMLLRELDIKPGMAVADIGAGTGYYSRRMAPLVTSSGVVYAVDVQPEMIQMLTDVAKKAGLTNVKPVLGQETNVNLADSSIALAIMVDVYHELAFPYEVMQSLVRALKPGGRVAYVEYRAEDPRVPIKALHKMSQAQVRKEAAAHTLVYERTAATLPWQHVIIFRKP